MTFEYGKLPPSEIWFGASSLWPRLDLAQQIGRGWSTEGGADGSNVFRPRWARGFGDGGCPQWALHEMGATASADFFC